MLDQARGFLQSHFGYDSFRTGQEQAISQVLSGENTICVMPTGGGKSICYQIPALVLEGTTIVVSPLISLMKDQVDGLLAAGIPAAYINSSLSSAELSETMQAARRGEYKLLYIAPERLESYSFVERLKQLTVPLIAVDEAHCISQWGHDFRPSYRHIQRMTELFAGDPTVLALTATATPNVREDICRLLSIEEEKTVITGFERKNLSFSVIQGQDRNGFLKDYLTKNAKESGIIYAATRKTVDQLYERLQRSGISAARYHGGMSDVDRIKEQDRFLADEATVMVATNAFGMGIDKSNIRYVIHYQLPKNMESYYQEAGRAGRDGLDSECIVLYSSQDVQTQRFLIDQALERDRIPQELEKLQGMVDYCHTERCLQQFIVAYFGEPYPKPCGRCGNCTDSRDSVDITKEAQMVLSCVIRMGQRFGKAMTAQVLTGSKNKKLLEFGFDDLSTYGILKKQSVKDVSNFIEFLISQELIGVEPSQFPTIFVTEQGRDVLLGKEMVMRKVAVRTKKIATDDPLFDALRALRKELAEDAGVPPFVIFSDKTLQDMCDRLPMDEQSFLQVSGVGESKLQKYGAAFLEEIRAFSEVKKEPKKKSVHSYLDTLELHQKGLAPAAIAAERELTVGTVENHLLQCMEEGLDVNLDLLVPPAHREKIEKAVEEAGAEQLKPIKELVPEDVTYGMIKVFLEMRRRNHV
ncbi:DNA helicase RecQ [Domibacillus enclensis]|uniref:DNA helicase RecQ n=1 Tax=Domibacillus enclensis TaxID=1017273 RepID=A0A1N6SFW8_9BACI|nr:DNA helicase RecQ [Domibacillus enclensis]OXS79316.1 DNA helicase RecQ [Domibacillus enclensis]SIQ39988.1 ATP-dependent DNA helicase, RecQ-like [Domibacillus enclensis]